MNKVKRIIIILVAAAAVTAAVIFSVHYFSVNSRNTRTVTRALQNTKSGQGKVEELIAIDYDVLYVFEPYQSIGQMERQIGFSVGLLQSGMSQSDINYLFVKDKKPVAYFVGTPEKLGFCINLSAGEYGKEELDSMSYEAETRGVGNSYGKEKTYQDYNFYFKDETELSAEASGIKGSEGLISIPVGEDISIDINGGETETIRYDVTGKELSINGTNYIDSLEKLGITMENPKKDSYYIVDLNTEDKYREIALSEEKEGENPRTYFFRYTNQELIYMGSISDLPDSETCRFQMADSGQGEIIASFELEILQKWYAQGYWKVGENGKLEFMAQAMYYLNDPYQAELLCALPVYAEADKKSEQTVMEAGKVSFTATDNKNWVQIEDESGKQGWFYVEKYDTIADTDRKAQEVFRGLTTGD